MTGDEFTNLFTNNQSLREYILIQAKRRSRIKEQQEDSVQEAWLIISTAPSGKCLEFYQELAYKAIYASYWQQYKQRLLRHTHDQYVDAASHKTPERPTDNDRRFMDEKVRGRNWRD